jgi:hypothetical protein
MAEDPRAEPHDYTTTHMGLGGLDRHPFERRDLGQVEGITEVSELKKEVKDLAERVDALTTEVSALKKRR